MPKAIPYGRHHVDDNDIEAVAEALRSDWLTTGPQVAAFEQELARQVGAAHAVAVNSGTAALHAAMHALDLGPEDEVIVPTITFAASANCVLYAGAKPVLCDVDGDTLLIDPEDVERRITPRTRAIIAVDYAGQPCDYERLGRLARDRGLTLIADGCHALGAEFGGQRVGSLAAATTFSFHPVKHITTGEGGMLTTDDPEIAARARRFRSHGIDVDAQQRAERATWRYDMVELGFNYRLSDIVCALGRSQLRKLSGWLDARARIAARYDRALEAIEGVTPLARRPGVRHAYHLYVVRIDAETTRGRDAVFEQMRADGIGVNVHYVPVHLHSYYRNRFGTSEGMLPTAEAAFAELLSLPIYPGLIDEDVDRVVATLRAALECTHDRP